MKEHSLKNSNIAHLGRNFWRKLVADCPTYNFESDNSFLLFLDDDGLLLECFHLGDEEPPYFDVKKARMILHKLGVTAIVRLQTQPAFLKNPLERNSLQAEWIYSLANFYNLHLADVVLPRFI